MQSGIRYLIVFEKNLLVGPKEAKRRLKKELAKQV